jgi:hypothetical protein
LKGAALSSSQARASRRWMGRGACCAPAAALALLAGFLVSAAAADAARAAVPGRPGSRARGGEADGAPLLKRWAAKEGRKPRSSDGGTQNRPPARPCALALRTACRAAPPGAPGRSLKERLGPRCRTRMVLAAPPPGRPSCGGRQRPRAHARPPTPSARASPAPTNRARPLPAPRPPRPGQARPGGALAPAHPAPVLAARVWARGCIQRATASPRGDELGHARQRPHRRAAARRLLRPSRRVGAPAGAETGGREARAPLGQGRDAGAGCVRRACTAPPGPRHGCEAVAADLQLGRPHALPTDARARACHVLALPPSLPRRVVWSGW